MAVKIRLEKHFQESTFHNPMLGNALDTQQLEIRKDPLTGYRSVFNARLEDKVALFFGPSDPALIERLARETESRCFLCGDRWKQMTPAYAAEVIPEGRIEVGQAVLFPNLFPVSQVHAVTRVGASHYVPLKEFEVNSVREALHASLAFVKRISRAMATVRFISINGNYLGPAGASIAHPHFQIVGGDQPFSYLEHILELSRKYHGENGSCYWTDLLEMEKEAGDRFIGETGAVEWITAFSPQGSNEILGILGQRRDFLEISEKDMEGLSEGFCKVLKGYDLLGMSTFNFSFYSGPLATQDDSFRCYVRIISRQNVYENYRTDDYFLQKLLRDELILTPPESLASTMRKAFSA
jgi:UDPglucose--hexose-1-phosphate uridylyltransferase